MGLFKTKKGKAQPSASPMPVVTYHLTQSLSGVLTATPTATTLASSSSHPTYTIHLHRPKARRDSIEISVRRATAAAAADPVVVGHCLIQVSSGKFLDCHMMGGDGDGGGDAGTEVKIAHSGGGGVRGSEGSRYAISMSRRQQGATSTSTTMRWVHDAGTLHGGRVSADRWLRLEGEGDGGSNSGAVLARFAGSSGGVSEFGVLEVYAADEEEGEEKGGDWCGLLVLTAVCVYAREERYREKKGKVREKWEVVGGVGDLLGIVGGI